MSDFHFSHPIEIRYGDLDPQPHLNNAKYFTLIDHAIGSTVQVAYDYQSAQTIPIPDEWRIIITRFEHLNSG